MKTELQIKALAELDGWKQVWCKVQEWDETLGAYAPFERQLFERQLEVCLECVSERRLPSYLTSYDAILPLIQKQSYSIVDYVLDWCNTKNNCRHGYFVATPFQLCEALLRATGKWTE